MTSNNDLFPDAPSPRLMPILPNMYQNFAAQDTKTRSIDLARKIILELSESEARTKDGDVCVGKDEILKITNKRRLYDVTGPLEAMGLIETTKINIIWTGCRMGAFGFVHPTARNAMAIGRNADELHKFGHKSGVPGAAQKVQRVPDVQSLPKIPRKKKCEGAEARERLKYLLKRRSLLLGELKEKEAQTAKLKPLGIGYNDICIGVQVVIQQMHAEAQSSNYTKAFPELQSTVPNLYIVSGEHTLQIMESQPVLIRSNLEQPRFQEKVFFDFTASASSPKQQQLEIHYIDNNNMTTISPNMNTMHLRASENQFSSPPFNKHGFYETPLLDQLKFGDWDQPE